MSQGIILLLEDNLSLLKANQGVLTMSGYRVVACSTIMEARAAVEHERPDLLILDVMLPDGSGVDFCREYREEYGKGIPVLFLSVLNKKGDILAGYGAGGTDYLTKPYDMDVLLIKVAALLEQFSAAGAVPKETVIDTLRMNPVSKRAYLEGEDLLLKPKEYALLEMLAHNLGRYVPAAELYQKIWDMETAGDIRTVKVHISSVRQKLKDKYIIEAGRKEGYRLVKKQKVNEN